MTRADQTSSPIPLLELLPPDERARLVRIGGQSRTAFGPLPLQILFNAHLSAIEDLVKAGATTAILATLLSEVGINRADGSKLTEGTVSSALSRARAQQRAEPRNRPTYGLRSAGQSSDLQELAGLCSAVQRPTARASPSALAEPLTPSRSQKPLPSDTSRSAALLELIRNQDET